LFFFKKGEGKDGWENRAPWKKKEVRLSPDHAERGTGWGKSAGGVPTRGVFRKGPFEE